jgi:hypothetical protein
MVHRPLVGFLVIRRSHQSSPCNCCLPIRGTGQSSQATGGLRVLYSKFVPPSLKPELLSLNLSVRPSTVPEIINPVFTKTSPKRSFCMTENERFGLVFVNTGARIYRPSFHENKPKTLVFSHTKRGFLACFRENWVYNFGHGSINSGTGNQWTRMKK